MKTTLFLALLGLVSCGSPSAPAADPRIAEIKALHQQILAQQKPLAETEKDPSLLRYGHLQERQQSYKQIVARSEANLATLDQLDPAKSQDATQAALVGESLRQEQALASGAARLVALNQKFITDSKQIDKVLDDVKNDPRNKALNLR